jgi:adenylate kinase family enzyme
VERIVVVGPPGSGKTTLGRTLAERLDCAHVEMDSLWWDADWTEAGPERFRERAEVAVRGERWVADGNYVSTGARDVVWPLADTLIWLDQPRWVTVPRVVRRTFSRGVRRTELWSGNRESLRLALRPDSIIWFAWRAHPKYNRRYEGLDEDPAYAHLDWIRLRSPRAVRRWLSSVRSG